MRVAGPRVGSGGRDDVAQAAVGSRVDVGRASEIVVESDVSNELGNDASADGRRFDLRAVELVVCGIKGVGEIDDGETRLLGLGNDRIVHHGHEPAHLLVGTPLPRNRIHGSVHAVHLVHVLRRLVLELDNQVGRRSRDGVHDLGICFREGRHDALQFVHLTQNDADVVPAHREDRVGNRSPWSEGKLLRCSPVDVRNALKLGTHLVRQRLQRLERPVLSHGRERVARLFPCSKGDGRIRPLQHVRRREPVGSKVENLGGGRKEGQQLVPDRVCRRLDPHHVVERRVSQQCYNGCSVIRHV